MLERASFCKVCMQNTGEVTRAESRSANKICSGVVYNIQIYLLNNEAHIA